MARVSSQMSHRVGNLISPCKPGDAHAIPESFALVSPGGQLLWLYDSRARHTIADSALDPEFLDSDVQSWLSSAQASAAIDEASRNGCAECQALATGRGSDFVWHKTVVAAIRGAGNEVSCLACVTFRRERGRYADDLRHFDMLINEHVTAPAAIGFWWQSCGASVWKCCGSLRRHFGLTNRDQVDVESVRSRLRSVASAKLRRAYRKTLDDGRLRSMMVDVADVESGEHPLLIIFGGAAGLAAYGISIDLGANGSWRRCGRASASGFATGGSEETLDSTNLNGYLIDTIENERTRLAAELHDEMGSILTLMSLQIGEIEAMRMPGESGDAFCQSVARLRDLVLSLDHYKHRVVEGLRPPLLQELGLEQAIRHYIGEFRSHAGLRVSLQVPMPLPVFREKAALTLFRAIQELLTNAARHASASSIVILIAIQSKDVWVTVADDGIGMLTTSRRVSGYGLVGLRERVRSFGGCLRIESRPSVAGTTVRISLPLTSATCFGFEVDYAKACRKRRRQRLPTDESALSGSLGGAQLR